MAGMKEEVRWLIGIGVILAGLILNLQRVDGNRIARLEQALAEHRVETAAAFERLEDALTEHRVESAREFGKIESDVEFPLTGDPPGGL